MASIRGADTNVILKKGTTHGTAVEGGAGDKLAVESITWNETKETLSSNNIGTGLSMEETVDFGSSSYEVVVSMQGGYNNGFDRILGILQGGSTTPAEQNVGEGDYLVKYYYVPSVKKFCTIAFETSSTTVVEFPSCYPVGITLTSTPDQRLLCDVTFVADRIVTSSTVNTNAELQASTIANTKKIVGNINDNFWLNGRTGDALDSGDIVCPSSVSFAINDPKESGKCFSGTSSLAAPIRIDLLTGEMTLEFLELSDHTYLDYLSGVSELKASFTIEGSQIAAGDNYKFQANFPNLVITNVSYSVASAGVNPMTVTCKLLKAPSNPTGMDYPYPYFVFVNTAVAAAA